MQSPTSKRIAVNNPKKRISTQQNEHVIEATVPKSSNFINDNTFVCQEEKSPLYQSMIRHSQTHNNCLALDVKDLLGEMKSVSWRVLEENTERICDEVIRRFPQINMF